MDQETIGVGTMIDVKIGELSFRLTQAEARKLRDLLTAALGDARQHPVPMRGTWSVTGATGR